MMKNKVFYFLIALMCISATCRKAGQSNLPACVQNLIVKIKAEKVWNPPARIWQYQYEGKLVYYVPQRCCDIPSTLYDADCKIICHPDGGFTGRGDGKCKDFVEKRTDGKLIWKDERK